MDSRPEQALVWGQAGGSLKADSAGVWWCSMPFERRIQYTAFIDNQETIENDWDPRFGDRKNEIVIIGQNMDEKNITAQFDACLSSDEELTAHNWEIGYPDQWAVKRAYALE